jgi:hypothetical protein
MWEESKHPWLALPASVVDHLSGLRAANRDGPQQLLPAPHDAGAGSFVGAKPLPVSTVAIRERSAFKSL